MSHSILLDPFYSTFAASIRSVGTASTLAAVGVYLHRRKFVTTSGKRTLALISQQVTIPLFLFTNINCNQNWSSAPCPDIRSSLSDVWVLLFWPVFVVSCGLVVGWLAAWASQTPPQSRKSVLVACAFGNSTGLPITLLTVVHANFKDTKLGQVDPTLFLSIYLLLYPVLQWGIGGWLLAPEEDTDRISDHMDDTMRLLSPKSLEENGAADVLTGTLPHDSQSRRPTRRNSITLGRNVLNNKQTTKLYKESRRGMHETDASLYISDADLVELGKKQSHPTAIEMKQHSITSNEEQLHAKTTSSQQDCKSTSIETIKSASVEGEDSILATLQEIASRCLQPPAVAAMLGLVVAVTPLQGIFVDTDAPLEWFFDGLYAVGQAAVPINMIILGCNLSASQLKTRSPLLLSRRTMLAIVIGKMLIMPAIGIFSVIILKSHIWNVPDGIDASLFLVAMIVFITPTANNVMIMVELSGSGSKEGIAQVIMWQYAIAPLVLSLTMSVAVWVVRE